MASAAGLASGITPDLVRTGLAGDARVRSSTLVLTDSTTDPHTWRARTFLLRHRQEGFMLLMPYAPEIQLVLDGHEVAGERPMLSVTQIALETNRGRPLGDIDVYIADVPWSFLPLLRKAISRAPAGVQSIIFTFGEETGRPVLRSAEEAAQAWVSELLDTDSAVDYVTGEEGAETPVPDGLDALDDVPADEDLDGEPLDTATAQSAEVAALRS